MVINKMITVPIYNKKRHFGWVVCRGGSPYLDTVAITRTIAIEKYMVMACKPVDDWRWVRDNYGLDIRRFEFSFKPEDIEKTEQKFKELLKKKQKRGQK
jgi:hypothetical protein